MSKRAKASAAADPEPEPPPAAPTGPTTPLQRWRLVLGGEEADGICLAAGEELGARELAIDRALAMLYDPEEAKKNQRKAGLGGSAPTVARWLGDVRRYFPQTVVRVLQKDAFERLNLRAMLLEPEMLEAVEPDVGLVSTIMALNGVIPEKSRETARAVVRKVVDDLMKRLEQPMRTAVTGSLNRATRNNRPRHNEIDWNRTIRANLRHYQAEYGTIVPERLIGWGRQRTTFQKRVILCIDQSGSMAGSIVYSSIFGAVMASIPAVKTHLVVFDTAVVDLTEEISDPVDVLFGVQLGGGTDINRAVGYCQGLIQSPEDTIFVLISDLYEGGVAKDLLRRTAEIVQSGTTMIALLALSDEGAPMYDGELAGRMTALGCPAFACTPEVFPDLMAAAIRKTDIAQWAAERGIKTERTFGDE